MADLVSLLKQLCELDGPSGREYAVANFIYEQIKNHCDAKIDAMGNVIAFKQGEKRPVKKVMLDAHMDEVGIIITDITDSGLLKFTAVGGIKPEALLCKRVRFGNVMGVIGTKPVHQSSADEKKSLPLIDSLYVDIGAADKEAAQKLISLGDIGTFEGKWAYLGDNAIRTKAIDDRIGCAMLITLLQQKAEYDFYAAFTVGEELGLRGAKTAAFSIDPEYAIVLESTTAVDICGATGSNAVCRLGKGVVVAFMDSCTLYDRKLYNYALKTANENGIAVQTKQKVAGGNDAGAISLNKNGVQTITLAQPSRYIHSPSTVIFRSDMEDYFKLANLLLNKLAAGEFHD